jgi:hypothetical protein
LLMKRLVVVLTLAVALVGGVAGVAAGRQPVAHARRTHAVSPLADARTRGAVTLISVRLAGFGANVKSPAGHIRFVLPSSRSQRAYGSTISDGSTGASRSHSQAVWFTHVPGPPTTSSRLRAASWSISCARVAVRTALITRTRQCLFRRVSRKTRNRQRMGPVSKHSHLAERLFDLSPRPAISPGAPCEHLWV